MLPRQPTLLLRPPAQLNPSPSHSCKLFCALKKINSHQISNFRTLFAKHPGWGVHPRRSIFFAPAVGCATQRLYPLRPQPLAHISRRHWGVLPRSRRLCVSVPLWQIPCSQQFAASLASLCALLRTPVVCFQSFAASFTKTPGGGGRPLKFARSQPRDQRRTPVLAAFLIICLALSSLLLFPVRSLAQG